MTEQEAIEIVSKEKAYMDAHAGRSQSEALGMAIEALEKQIPKEPENNISMHICPTCKGMDIEQYHELGGVTYLKHCPDCGQAIDWGG